MAINLGRWFRDRKKQAEGVVAQANPFDGGKTYNTVINNTPVAKPVQTQVNTAQPGWSVRTQPTQPSWLQKQNDFNTSLSAITAPKPQVAQTPKAQEPNLLQQRIDKSYGTGFTATKNRLRDVLDGNTSADRIRRMANTGLNESYKQQQDRLTQVAINSSPKRSGANQVSAGTLSGVTDFFGKAAGSAAELQGRIGSIENPIARTAVKLVTPGGAATLFQSKDQAKRQFNTGKQMNEFVENKKQQSGIGARKDDNKWLYGGGQVAGQLPAQIATGGVGLLNTGAQMAASEANKAQAKGKTNEQALGIGLAQGALSAASEKFGIDRFLPGSGGSNAIINAIKRFGTEGLQEAQQQFTQNLVANKTYDPTQSLKEGVGESFVLGGVAGSAMSPFADIGVNNKPQRPEYSPTPQDIEVMKDLSEMQMNPAAYSPREQQILATEALEIKRRGGPDLVSGSRSDINETAGATIENFQNTQPEFNRITTAPVNQLPDAPSMVARIQAAREKVPERFKLNKYGGSNADFDSPTIRNDLTGEVIPNPAYRGKNVDPLESLKQEARKYKSAEEFVAKDKIANKKSHTAGNGGKNDGNPQSARIKGDSIVVTNRHGRKQLDSYEIPLEKWEQLEKSFGNPNYNIKQFIKSLNQERMPGNYTDIYNSSFIDRLEDNQISAIKSAYEAHTKRQQLTDLYNQAHAEAKAQTPNESTKRPIKPAPAKPLSVVDRVNSINEAPMKDKSLANLTASETNLPTSKNSGNLLSSTTNVKLVDHTGKTYTESEVPVLQLVRRAEFQPRTTKSGIGTENSVFEKGYQEGLVDQPLLVRKNGDKYEVLGGHSRTSGMERRAEAGLPNPESVKARVYEGITDAEARAISRSANQGGQYESTLDMAKSISDSTKEGVSPSVQKQNMLKGYTTEDYNMLWDIVGNDAILKDKVFHGAISQEDMLAISRQARMKSLDSNTARAIVNNMDKNGTLTKTGANNVISMIASKRLKSQISDAQSGMFDIEALTTPDATKLLSDRAIVQADLTSRINALNKVKKEGVSTEVMASLESINKDLAQKMHDIEKEVIAKYNADIEARNATQVSLTAGKESKTSNTPPAGQALKLVRSTPITVRGNLSNKNIPVRKLTQEGDVVTATNVNPDIKATEKRYSIDDSGQMIEDRKGAYRIFNDGEGKITGVRIGKKYYSTKELGDLSDVNDYGSSLATMRRNIERAFGKETGDKLSRFVVDHQQKQATKLIDRQVKLKQGTDALAKELGISFGMGSKRAKQVSASIQDYGEKNITKQDLVKQYGNDMANKIVKADSWFKSQYDQLLDEMNTTLTTYGYDPVPRRKNYYTHFQDQSLWSKVGLKMQEIRSLSSPTMQDSMPAPTRGKIDNTLAGQSEFLLPNKRFNPFALQRKGDTHTSDAFQSFERYLTPTLNNIYMTPSITRARVVSKAVAEQANLAGKDANGVMIQMREWANRLAGKTSRIDRPLVDSKWGNTALRASQWAQRKAGANTIVGNLSTAVMQPVVLTQTTGKFGLRNTLLATVQEMSTAHSKDAPIRQSEFMRRRYADIANTTRGKIDRAADIANTPLKVVEETAARITWNAAHNDALSKGIRGDAAIKYADVQAEKTLAGRSIGERPELFDAKAPGIFTMYQLEVNNYWQQVGKEMTKAQAARTMAASYGFNLLMGAINGRSVGFNPIDAILDSIGMLDDEDEDNVAKAKRIAQRLGGELVDSLPFAGAVGTTVMGEQGWKDLMGKDSTSGRFGFSNAPRTLYENPGMLITPFGYNQARKTIQGLDTWRKGQLESKSGKKLTDVPQTKTNLAKALAFGKSAIPEVSEYYNNIGQKKTNKNATGVAGIRAENERLNEELRKTLSDDDYAISKMSKADRQKVVDMGIKSQADLDGLDNYVRQQKTRLGMTVAKDKKGYYKTNDAEYNAFKDEYNQKIKDGSYSKAQRIKADYTLSKLKVGSNFSKDSRDLYNVSEKALSSWLATEEKGVDKQKLANELIAYDQALYNAGLISRLKYKGGIAAKSSGRGGRRGGGRGRKSSFSMADFTTNPQLQTQTYQNLNKLLAGTTFKGGKKPSKTGKSGKVAQKQIKVNMKA